MKQLKYPYKISGNKLTIQASNRVTVITANSNVIQVNGKSVKLKGKVTKSGKYFIAPADVVRIVAGKGSVGYYEGSQTISIRVDVYKPSKPSSGGGIFDNLEGTTVGETQHENTSYDYVEEDMSKLTPAGS